LALFKRLNANARSIALVAEGNYAVQIPVTKNNDEIDYLAKTINFLSNSLKEKNEHIGIIMGNVSAGILLINRELKVTGEFTQSCVTLFSQRIEAQKKFTDLFDLTPTQSATMRLLLDQLFEDILPEDMSLEQLPKRMTCSGKQLDLSFGPVRENNTLSYLLITVIDSTELVKAQAEFTKLSCTVSILK
jgi:hypothetical protein